MTDRLPMLVAIGGVIAGLSIGVGNGFPIVALALYVVGVAASGHWAAKKATTAIRNRGRA